MSTFAKVRAFLLVGLFAAAPLTPAVKAQDAYTTVTVNIPFAFEDGSQHFSAGQYRISIDAQHLATLDNYKRKAFALTWFDTRLNPAKTSRLVFEKYGNHYFLSELFIAGETSHTVFPTSKREQLEMASLGGTPNNVEVAALEPAR